MKQRISWEADSHSGSQWCYLITRNQAVDCHVQNSPSLGPILSQMNPLHTLTFYFYFNIKIIIYALVSQVILRLIFFFK
jgi:hypothetical protein